MQRLIILLAAVTLALMAACANPTPTPIPPSPTPSPLSGYSDLPVRTVDEEYLVRTLNPFILQGCIAGPIGLPVSNGPGSYVVTFDGHFRRAFPRAVVSGIDFDLSSIASVSGCYNMAVQFDGEMRVVRGLLPPIVIPGQENKSGSLTPIYRAITPTAFERVAGNK